MKKMYRVAGQKERWLHAVGAQARGPRLVGAHATRSGREKFDYFSIIFDYFSAAPPPNLVGGGARTNFSICCRPTFVRTLTLLVGTSTHTVVPQYRLYRISVLP